MEQGKLTRDREEALFVSVVVALGLALRIHLALLTYLNPDEAEHVLATFGGMSETLRASLGFTHPPLLLMVIHFIGMISRTEFALRLVPLLAGSLFPFLLYRWLRRLCGPVAGMVALLVLTLGPYSIALSAQVRSYTLALLFLSAALLALEESLENTRWQMMALFSLFLWLCILSDYSMAWFVGGAAVYALLRLRASPLHLKILWAAGQLIALALYGFLYVTQVRRFRGSSIEIDAVNNSLRDGFPRPGEFLFPLTHLPRQFAYILASRYAGDIACVLCVVSIFWLWTGRSPIERTKARALSTLLALPFLLAIAGSYVHQFPFGAHRQTVVLGVLGVVGIAIFLATIPRRTIEPVLWGMLLLIPFWSLKGDNEDIALNRHDKKQMMQCLAYMREVIPAGAVIFTERETLDLLSYYLGENRLAPWAAPGSFGDSLIDGRWRVATRDYGYTTPGAYQAAMADFRRQYGLRPEQPVWVVDGGWQTVAAPPDPERPYTNVIRVFQSVGEVR